MLVHKCFVKYSRKILRWVLHWVLVLSLANIYQRNNSYEYSLEYTKRDNTHKTCRVLARVIWVLMLASRTRLMSIFTRVIHISEDLCIMIVSVHSSENSYHDRCCHLLSNHIVYLPSAESLKQERNQSRYLFSPIPSPSGIRSVELINLC